MLIKILAYTATAAIGLVIGITLTGGLVDTHTLINGMELTPTTQQAAIEAMQRGGAAFEQFTTLRLGGDRSVSADGLWLYWVVLLAPVAVLGTATYAIRSRRSPRGECPKG